MVPRLHSKRGLVIVTTVKATTTTRLRPDDDDRLVDSLYVAQALGITRTTGWRYVTGGVFGPPIDVASPGSARAQLRVRKSAVDAFIAERTLTVAS